MRLGYLLPLVLIVAGCSGGEHAPTTSTSGWEKDVLAASASGPVLVDFGATWCGPCRQMEPIVAKLAREFPVRAVDVDQNRELAKNNRIKLLPTFLIFVDGKEQFRHEGMIDEGSLRAEMRKLSRK